MDEAAIAHLLRRTGFGPYPGQVEDLAGGGIEAAVDAVLAAPPLDPGDPPSFRGSDEGPVHRWLALMAEPAAGLHEKLTWFWHGHFTSSYDKVGDWAMLWQQHLLLREHALGNFRTLAQAVTVDPAMLVYLDGDGSQGSAPNENYSRELMELFTLGRGAYTQDDVVAGAIALSGWYVDYEQGTASFDPSSGPPSAVTFLGREVADAAGVVDAVCDHPACPGFIAAELHGFLAGTDPEPGRIEELASVFVDSGLEISALVDAIVRHPSFVELRLNRPRYPVEWVTAAMAALGIDDRDTRYGYAYTLNQLPFYPPNVAGFPGGTRWLSASYAIAKASLATQATAVPEVRDAADPVAAVLARCGLYEPSSATVAALQEAAAMLAEAEDPDAAAALLVGMAVASPDFAVA